MYLVESGVMTHVDVDLRLWTKSARWLTIYQALDTENHFQHSPNFKYLYWLNLSLGRFHDLCSAHHVEGQKEHFLANKHCLARKAPQTCNQSGLASKIAVTM